VGDLPGLPDLHGDEWAGHAELATVPMGMSEDDDDSLVEREAWLDGLKVGDLCRLMLQGRWVTALLNWRSDNGQFFMFKSRRGSGSHTITAACWIACVPKAWPPRSSRGRCWRGRWRPCFLRKPDLHQGAARE
jgi:hypothetical protein